jgi:hypothetical protein
MLRSGLEQQVRKDVTWKEGRMWEESEEWEVWENRDGETWLLGALPKVELLAVP